MATQADIDALTQMAKDNQDATIKEIGDSKATLLTVSENEHQEVMAEIAKLQAANPALDLSALTAAVSGSKDAISAAVKDSTDSLTASVQGIITPDAPPATEEPGSSDVPPSP